MRRQQRRDSDQVAVRRTAVRTAAQVAVVATVIVLLCLLVAVVVVIDQSRPTELLEPALPGEQKIYLDVREVLVALVGLGASAIAVVAVASWAISRRAVAPLGEALAVQRAFVSDAGHELRTPLAVLDARLQVLRDEAVQAGAPTEGLTAARRDVTRMIDLVGDLLLVAEAAARLETTLEAQTDLRPVVLEAVRDLQVLAAERDVRLQVEIRNEARVGLTDIGLRRALMVLLDNALRHTGRGRTILVTASREKRQAVIRVVDEGSGIEGIAPERVFERFAHGAEDGRRRSFGIGLALVRDLATRAGGRVLVESTSPAGTTMRLELPVAR